ncbi:MAG: hypothetical protein ACREOS_10245, partial [Candidatus Dormibacteraceae bacterium]
MSKVRPPEEIILDACCLISLVGTRCFRDILVALPLRFLVARYVCDREALYTLVDPSTSQTERIDLEPLIVEGLIHVVDLETDAEAATMVELATKIEHGEAHTCALAVHRGY